MRAKLRWFLLIGVGVVLVALVWFQQARKTSLFQQAAFSEPKLQVKATQALLAEELLPGALPPQPVAVRSKISRPLAAVGSPEALAVLIGLLSDTEDAPRVAAANALAGMGEAALPALSQVLVEGDDNAKKKAIEALGRIGAPAVPYLRRLLENPGAQGNACLALGSLAAEARSAAQKDAAYKPLLRAISSQDSGLANAAIPVLGDAKLKAAVEPLRTALRQEALRKNAVIALGAIGDARATLDLIPFIDDPALRMDAVRALGQIGNVRAAAPLSATLGDSNEDYRSSLVLALQRIGALAAVQVAGYLRSPDLQVRRAAAQALAGDAVPAVLPALRQALADPDAEVRIGAASALGWPGNAAAIPLLLSALRDKEGVVVDAALGGLAGIGPAAVPSLLQLFSSPEPVYALYASRALVRMGDAAAPSLLRALESPQTQTRLWAAVTLGDMDEKQAIPALRRLHRNSQGNVQWAAEQALRKLGIVASPKSS